MFLYYIVRNGLSRFILFNLYMKNKNNKFELLAPAGSSAKAINKVKYGF